MHMHNWHNMRVFLLGALVKCVSLQKMNECVQVYSQCGGIGWIGPTCCVESVCVVNGDYYSQCLPGHAPSTSSSSRSTTATSSTSTATSSNTSNQPSPTTTGPIRGIGIGSSTSNYLPPFPVQIDGKSLDTSLTIDANWRWVHEKEGYQSCYTDKSWNIKACPDPQSCASNCVIEGVSQSQWLGTYGVDVQPSKVTLKLVTGSNIGSRLFLLDQSGNSYYGFNLMNREFAFTVDASKLGCGLNGALYLVSMNLTNHDPQVAGPAYGLGYADAQCPNDIKYINGFPNVDTTPLQPCASEMDIWEANAFNTALTPHPCSSMNATVCSDDVACGNGDANRYKGQCDKDGADLNPYRLGITDFYGSGQTVDSGRPVTVYTQFLTSDGTDSGDLVEITRYYVQDGKRIEGGSITDALTFERKSAFNETNQFAEQGGLKAMGERIRNGMVLVFSIWGDTISNMEWLDSTFPENETKNGSVRGICPKGTYQDTIAKSQNAAVTFGDIKVGKIGSL